MLLFQSVWLQAQHFNGVSVMSLWLLATKRARDFFSETLDSKEIEQNLQAAPDDPALQDAA